MNGFIATYTGRFIEPLNPDPAQINIEDIAHALSNNCRFTGHVREFYSVGQHSVLVSRNVPDKDRLAALLHDASEAYLSDIARPVKQQPEFGTVYKAAEERLMEAIALAFDFEWPMSAAIKKADNQLLVTEARDLMYGGVSAWEEPLRSLEPLGETITGWLPFLAKEAFLSEYMEITARSWDT